MNILRCLSIMSSLCYISACTTTSAPDSAKRTPVKVENRIILHDDVMPLPDQPDIKSESQSTDLTMSVVVNTLLTKAETQRSAGNWEASIHSLERALRVEPRNAVLWNRLAQVHYDQHDMHQAVHLAAKSNTLAGQNKSIRRQNWYLMSNAYKSLGDQESADIYRQKLIN